MPQHRRNVFIIESDESFIKTIQELSNGFIVVKFFATWCNHCEIMKPIFYKLAAKYRSIKFMDVNIETCQNSAECYKITCLPSFIIFENGERTTSFCGADPSVFEQKVLEIAECSNAFKRSTKIKSKIIASELCHGLNMSPDSQIMHVLQSGKNSYIESQSGPQLLLSVVFCEYLNLGSISISGPEDRGPKLVSIYYNLKTNPDFRSILTYTPDEVLDLSTNELNLKLKKHLTNTKSDSVCKITMYIQSNQEEGDLTRIDQITFFKFKSERKRS